jgi:hypothetical protein
MRQSTAVINPWNDRRNTGLFPAFLVSVKMLVLNPVKFFDSWAPEKSLLGTAAFLGLTQFLFVTLIMSALTVMFPRYYLSPGMTIRAQLLNLLMSPAMTVVLTGVVTGVFQLAAKIVRGQGRYSDTFAIMAFISVSGVIMFLPAQSIMVKGILSLIAFGWNLALMLIGFRKLHQLSWGRAVGAIALGYLFAMMIWILASFGFWALSGFPRVCPVR